MFVSFYLLPKNAHHSTFSQLTIAAMKMFATLRNCLGQLFGSYEPSRIKTRINKVISNCDPKQIPHSNDVSLLLHNIFGRRFYVRERF